MIALLLASLIGQNCAAIKPQFQSAEMKKRAIHRVDIGQSLKQADIKAEIALELVVGVDGKVTCVRARSGHPLVKREVENAVAGWRFRPLAINGKPSAYAGQLRFVLCNISCGDAGPTMTLLRD